MIIPAADEQTWSGLLGGLPTWDPPAERMLVVAPHPDDETLGAGGLIAYQRSRGVEVTVAAVTDGERAYADSPGLGETRVCEQAAALGRLGVDESHILRLRQPDSNVSSFQHLLASLLMDHATPETHIVAPWHGDFHPDHTACGEAAETVARKAGARLTYYFFWTWHMGRLDQVEKLRLVSFPLSGSLLAAKLSALACHASQLQHETEGPILPDNLLAPARRAFEVFALA